VHFSSLILYRDKYKLVYFFTYLNIFFFFFDLSSTLEIFARHDCHGRWLAPLTSELCRSPVAWVILWWTKTRWTGWTGSPGTRVPLCTDRGWSTRKGWSGPWWTARTTRRSTRWSPTARRTSWTAPRTKTDSARSSSTFCTVCWYLYSRLRGARSFFKDFFCIFSDRTAISLGL